jgi:hypothetical protein
MGKGKYGRTIPPTWRTVGAMVADGVEVRAWCRKCNLVLEASPAMLAAYHGADFSLVNRLAKCRQVWCDGEVFFMANGRGRFESLLFEEGEN